MIYSIVGIVVALLFGFAAACSALECLLDRFWWWQELREQRAKETAARELGLRLTQQAYWFSEDKSAMDALTTIGEQLRDTGYFNTSNARDKWREMQRSPSHPHESTVHAAHRSL